MNEFALPGGILGFVLAILALVWSVLLILTPFVIYGIYQAALRIEKIAREMREADRIRWTREMNRERH